MAYTEDQVAAWQASNPTAGIDELTTALANGLQPLAQASPPPPQYESAPQRDIVETNRETSTGTAPIYRTAAEVYQNVLGRAPENKEVEKAWDDYFGGNVDVSKLQGFLRAATPELQSTGYKPATEGFNASAYMAGNKDVADAYAVDNYGLTPEQFAAEHYNIFGKKEGRVADPSSQYDKLVQDAYSTIQGRTGIGTDKSNIDQGGLDYWKNQLVSGAVTKDKFNDVFGNATSAYIKANPNDAYTQYVQNYQLKQQTDTIKKQLGDVLADSNISLDEAKGIKAYQDKYNFTPEQIASATGLNVASIKTILGSQDAILKNTVSANLNNPYALATFAKNNGFTAQQLADASGGAFTQAQAQSAIDKSGTFQGQIELISPTAYNQIANMAQYTANENFGGKIQDYQVQLFTPIDIKKSGIPTQLEFTPSAPITSYDENGNPYTYTPRPQIKNANVTQDEDGNYVSNTPTYVNGIPITVSYDQNGKATNFQGDPRVVTWLDGGHYVYGNWDAQGNAKPAQVATRGGGFFKNLAQDVAGALKDLGPLWTVAKIIEPQLSLVDVATDVGQGKFDIGTVMSGLSGYTGMQGADIAGMQSVNGLNSVSGLDLASDIATKGFNPAVQAASNISTAKLAASAISAVQAADKGNFTPLIAMGANVANTENMPTVSLAMSTLSAANAIAKNDLSGLLQVSGNLVNSPDLKVAGAATKLIQAYNSGNQSAVTSAGMELATAIDTNVPSATATLKSIVNNAVSSISPTTKTASISGEDIQTEDTTKPTGGLNQFADVKNFVTDNKSILNAVNSARQNTATQISDSQVGNPLAQVNTDKLIPITQTKNPSLNLVKTASFYPPTSKLTTAVGTPKRLV